MKHEIQLAKNLKELRRVAGMTRKDLAQKINYTDKAVEKWESGQSLPPLPVLCQIAAVLEVGLEELVFDRTLEVTYFLGIDGGGTKTNFRLETAEGMVVAECDLGPSNPNDVGMDRCLEILRAGIREVTSGVDPRKIAVFAGLAGSISPSNAEGVRRHLNQYDFGFVENGSDVENAMEMCLQGQDGVAVIAGTGTIAFAQKQGQRRRIGGWGYLLDSGGSGYNLGRDGLEAAFRALDGRGPKTSLLPLLEAELGTPLDHAIPEIYQSGKRLVASLAPQVFRACEEGDPVALEILRRNGQELAEMIRTAAGFVSREQVRVVICGGLAHREDLLGPVIAEQLPDTCQLQFRPDPMVSGAVSCARRKYAEYRKTE